MLVYEFFLRFSPLYFAAFNPSAYTPRKSTCGLTMNIRRGYETFSAFQPVLYKFLHPFVISGSEKYELCRQGGAAEQQKS